ncbi:MAG: hypothetical protein MJZ66_02225 [Bacteroidales bacterium]|nr:hypothetical protein [Bacteroidales bacterium]
MENISKTLKIAEVAELVVLGIIMLCAKLDIDDTMLRQMLIVTSLALAAVYMVSLFRISLTGMERGENALVIGRRNFALIALAMLSIGIMFKFKHFPGGSLMLILSSIALLVVFIMLIAAGDESDSQDNASEDNHPITFSKSELMPRVIAGLALGLLILLYGHRMEPYHAKTELVESLVSSEMVNVPISRDDAKLIAAWYDVSRGFKKEKVLEAYGVSEADFDSKAEALAYGGRENIPQERNIRIIGEYRRDRNWPYTDLKKLVAPEDTAYVYSLRSVVYQVLWNDPYIQRAMDLDNIAKHTDDKAFKAFVEKDLEEERFYLDRLPVIY